MVEVAKKKRAVFHFAPNAPIVIKVDHQKIICQTSQRIKNNYLEDYFLYTELSKDKELLKEP